MKDQFSGRELYVKQLTCGHERILTMRQKDAYCVHCKARRRTVKGQLRVWQGETVDE